MFTYFLFTIETFNHIYSSKFGIPAWKQNIYNTSTTLQHLKI